MRSCAFVLALFCTCHILIGQPKQNLVGSDWNDVLDAGHGELVFYWYKADPFVYIENDSLKGAEYELANAFKQFLEAKYALTLTSTWVSASRFEDIVNDISQTKGGVFGMSGVSITESRNKIVEFTPPYLPDICVIVSSQDVPVKNTFSGFLRSIEGLTAFIVKGSTFEQNLLRIQNENDIDFEFNYLKTTSDIISQLENTEKGFGYIDLPSFLIHLNRGTTVRRQYFYTFKLSGLSFAYPKDSDWKMPVEEYFNSAQFQVDKDRIIAKYFGEDVIDLIDRINKSADLGLEDEIVILTKEKELQYEELLKKSEQLKNDQRLIGIMVLALFVILATTAIYYTRYRTKLSANKTLAEKQAEIKHKNQQLTDLNNEKDNLIGVLAHDLRAPINRMLGITQIIIKEKQKDPQELVELIIKEAEGMKSLIKKILDVEAIENHRHNLKLEEVNATALIKNLVKNHEISATNKGIEIECNFANDEAILMADKIYLHQVLENLLSNAIKFSHADSVVRLEIDNNKNLLVIDQGPGFSEDDKQKIFKKFQLLSARPTAGEQSIGLGLITVKMLVELMCGSISFDSEQGKGTTFCIKLPQK